MVNNKGKSTTFAYYFFFVYNKKKATENIFIESMKIKRIVKYEGDKTQ